MKETTSARLRRLLSERNLRQVDILEKAAPYCKEFGVKLTKSDLSQYVTGKVVPGQDKLSILGLALGVSEAWLMGYDVPMQRGTSSKTDSSVKIPAGFEPLPKMVKVPLVGDIACGEPITAEQNIVDYVDVPEDARCDFALRCHGDSMIEAGIRDSDLVYIHIQPEVEDGQIAAVRIGDEATLKRVYYDGESLTLQPCNSAYRARTYRGQELENIRIEGKAVGFFHWV